MKKISGKNFKLSSLEGANGVDDTHIVQIIATRLTPPPSFRDQFSNWSWESVLIGTVSSFSAAYGDADCHVARPSLLAMTGQLVARRFRQNREALPLLGEVPSAHTGERGLRGRTRCRWEKTGRSADYSFPYWQFLSPGDPSVSLSLDSSPKRGAKGVDERRNVNPIYANKKTPDFFGFR